MLNMPNFSWPQVVALLGSITLVGGILVALVALGQNFGAIVAAIVAAAGALGWSAVQTAGGRAEARVVSETVIRQTNGTTTDLVRQNAEQMQQFMHVLTQLAVAVPPGTTVDLARPISVPPAPAGHALDGRVGP